MSGVGKKRELMTATRATSPPIKRKSRVQSTTTKSAVANFFKPTSQKDLEKTTWRIVDDSLLIASYENQHKDEKELKLQTIVRKKIAGFDLDSTLIVTRSGNLHARDEADWKWWHESVPQKLKVLYDEGYQIVVFTNQGGLKDPRKPSLKFTKFKNKVTAILNALDIPLHVYAATAYDKYRKPRIGMWQIMKEDYDLDAHGVELEESWLVGDAAGREGDFSDSDRHWAMNVGIQFYTPEMFFLKHTSKPMLHRFNPSSFLKASESATFDISTPDQQELIVMCGAPGSGKSSFWYRHFKPLDYDRVNQDTLKTREKCIKVATELLTAGRSVVIDNTNADKATRAIWVSLAKKYSIPVRCIYLNASLDLCQHNDAVRAFGGELVNPENRKLLPKIAFTGFASRFEQPETSEGFKTLTKVDFQWEGSSQELEIWQKYWI